jgi:hypothetical protein
MPRVPTYDNFQTTPALLPGARLDAPRIEGGLSPELATMGTRQVEQLGQTLTNTGNQASRILAFEVDKANQVRVNDAVNRAVQEKLRLTFDPAEGYAALRGDAALTRPEGKSLGQEYGERLTKTLNRLEGELFGDAQRRAFRQQADRLSLDFQSGLARHVGKEYITYQVSVQDGTIATARNQMALEWSSPESVSQARGAIQAAVFQKGKLAGLSGKEVEAAMVEALSPGHAAVITAAIDAGKMDYAREYLKQARGELTPQARLQLAKTMDAGDFEERAQAMTERLLGQAAGDVAQAMQLARAGLSGKEEDAVVQRLKAMDSEQEVFRNRAQGRAKEEAWSIYNQAGNLRGIPPSLQTRMDPQDWYALKKTAAADAKAAAAGTEVKTDPNVYYALTLAAAQDPNFKKEDLRRYFDRLSPSDRKHFMDLQGRVLKPGEADQVATSQQQVSTLVKVLDLKDEDAGIFMMEANKALFAAQQEKGRALDQDERQKVLDQLVVKGEVRTGKWYRNDPNMPFFRALNEGRAANFVPIWTDAQKNRASAALQRQGISAPTPQQVEAVLNATYGFQPPQAGTK